MGWTRKSDLLQATQSHACVTIAGKVYIFGGATGVITRDCAEYDPTTDTWVDKADMPLPARYVLAGAAANDKAYAMGGLDAGLNELADCDEYDPVANSWTPRADMTPARQAPAAGTINNKIYLVVGYSAFTQLRDCDEFDPATNTWTAKADIPLPARSCVAVAVLANKLYALGGDTLGGGNEIRDCDCYDPSTNSWAGIADLPIPARRQAGAVAIGGFIYIFGGYNSSLVGDARFLRDCDKYDPSTNSWTSETDILAPGRYVLGAAAIGDAAYLTGGRGPDPGVGPLPYTDCGVFGPVIPTVTTEPASAISRISATLNGTLASDGGESCICGFEWGLTDSYGMTTPTQSRVTSQTFSQAIGGLFPGFTYHFRAFATNSAGTGYGADRSFTTTPGFNRAHALSREEL